MLFLRNTAAAIAMAWLVSGCLSSPRPQVIVHESPRAVVYLERIADGEVKATHPISIDPSLMARMLRGLLIVDDRTTLQMLFGSDAKATRAFSDDEAAFLAPLIAKALSQVRPDQQVGFRLRYAANPIWRPASGGAAVGSSAPLPTESPMETTAGSLYAHGLSVHLTLTEFQHRATRPDTISGPNRYYPDTTGLDSREIAFVPQTAERPDGYKSTGLFGQSNSKTVVIDYQFLAKIPNERPPMRPAGAAPKPEQQPQSTSASMNETASPEPSRPSAKASTEEELQSVKDLVIKKDMELENLKLEIHSLRRQLAERDAQFESLKRKGKAAPR